ncbi:prepilin-type N-terminal cleavage/methylation domain-containing protein [Natroniella acetigena]|uniref:PulJ/GspJ family protein n=1 Tax=Natroniella acetigena TaxID=52004 RepID=UPI00200AA7BA|nr:prepilin-type N-terminal cleavage/methylation domain-containing protein [Natroniella acetigena]MCK8826652.1 prepilin-type N-terminal cleavage/methylation domain-containing protein [Natroniella acetigena]
MKNLFSGQDGYTVVEMMVVISILGILIGSLIGINRVLITTWLKSNLHSQLQQELRVSMNQLVSNLRSANKIIAVEQQRLSFYDQQFDEQEIYYQPEVGLAHNDDRNLISNRISDLKFELVADELLVIKLVAEKDELERELQTGLVIDK